MKGLARAAFDVRDLVAVVKKSAGACRDVGVLDRRAEFWKGRERSEGREHVAFAYAAKPCEGASRAVIV